MVNVATADGLHGRERVTIDVVGTTEWGVDVSGSGRSERQLKRELEAAAEYLLGGMLRDQDRIDDAVVKADRLLDVAVGELAEVAVLALARERGTTPRRCFDRL
jgi:hypothetical protein